MTNKFIKIRNIKYISETFESCETHKFKNKTIGKPSTTAIFGCMGRTTTHKLSPTFEPAQPSAITPIITVNHISTLSTSTNDVSECHI